MSHYLYLVRHGEHLDAEHGVDDGPLSPRGVRQAELLADRFASIPFDAAYTSPLERSTATADILATRMGGVAFEPTHLLFDCIPSGPAPDLPKSYQRFFEGIRPAVWEAGEAQIEDALAEFVSPSIDDRHTLLLTHNFVIGGLITEMVHTPKWRWLGLNTVNCAFAVLRVRSSKPTEIIAFNVMDHLPVELRTGVNANVSF